MSNFMTNQKVINQVGCLLPHGESQYAIVNVKTSSFYTSMLNNKVFGRKKASEVGFDFVVNGHSNFFRVTLLYKKKVPCGTPNGTVWKVVLQKPYFFLNSALDASSRLLRSPNKSSLRVFRRPLILFAFSSLSPLGSLFNPLLLP